VSANRLERRLARLRAEGQRGLAPYVTAGDGGLETTLAVLRAIEQAGATCVELGIPFSDPIADGPLLQASAQRALQAGTTFERTLEMLSRLRLGSDGRAPSELPVALMGYANTFLRRSARGAARAIAEAGGDALLVADLPVEEGAELASAALEAGLCPIFFAAPTTSDERIVRAARASRGFLYAIGRTGVTGRSTALDPAVLAFLERVRRLAGELPVAVGFGLSTREQVRAVTRHAELAIVGSALVERVHLAGESDPSRRPALAAEAAGAYVAELMEGVRAP